MRLWALEILRCPDSLARLELRDPVFEGEHIMTGTLMSPEGRSYPIVRGVPRLLVNYRSAAERQTVQAFGAEWKEFHSARGYMGSEKLFFQFLQGMQRSDFQGKTVLEAGCGNGRWIKGMRSLGSHQIVALDYSEAVDSCFQNTRSLDNVLVVQGSILALPLSRDFFDLVVSIGVLHHLENPAEGIARLAEALQPRGRLAFWVYAYEGNELYIKLIKPLRSVGPTLGKFGLLTLSIVLCLPVWVYVHTINRAFGFYQDGTPRLPRAEYFRLLSKLTYRDIVNIVYDQLTPQLAVYSRKKEVISWITSSSLELESLLMRTGNSWSVLARKTNQRP